MALTAKLVPGWTFAEDELLTAASLNALGNPTIEIEGAVTSASLGANSVTTANIVDGSVTYIKLAPDVLSAINAVTTRGTHRLRIAPVPTSTATMRTQVRIEAEDAVLKNASGANAYFQPVDQTVDITSTGPGGLENSGVAKVAEAWYYIWLVSNGTALAGMFSTSYTAPDITGYTTYTYRLLVGAVRTDSNGYFVNFRQVDDQVALATAADMGIPALNHTASVLTKDASAFVPATAKYAKGGVEISLTLSGGAANAYASVYGASDGTFVGASYKDSGNLYVRVSGPFEVPLITAQTIYYLMYRSTGTFTTDQAYMRCYGWRY